MNTITTRARRSFLLGGLCLLSLQEIFPSQGHAMYVPLPQNHVVHHAAHGEANAMVPAAEPEQKPWWKRAYSWCQQNQTQLCIAGITAAYYGILVYTGMNLIPSVNTMKSVENTNVVEGSGAPSSFNATLCSNAINVLGIPLREGALAPLIQIFPTQWLIEAGKGVYECCSNVADAMHNIIKRPNVDAESHSVIKLMDTFCASSSSYIDQTSQVLSSMKPAEDRCPLPHKHSQQKEELY